MPLQGLTVVPPTHRSGRFSAARFGENSPGDDSITPLKAITHDEAEDLAGRLYGMVPNARITGVLDDVDRWTGFSQAFTHLHTGLPANDPRVVLTGVLADATTWA